MTGVDSNISTILTWGGNVISNINPTVLILVISFGIISYFISRK